MSARLCLSVALATCNGERYLAEQLDGIARQTRLPDELVVRDDRSDDATPALVENFSRRAPFPVRLQINRGRLGSTRNFETAIRACSGEIIFLCDQDDVWYPGKIARIEECFIEDPAAGAVFTDADVVDAGLRPLGPRLWERVRFNPREQAQIAARDALSVLLKHHVVTGATMAFRSAYRDLLLPIPAPWAHDAWIALMIGTVSHLVALPVPLIAYRQHSGNQIGLPRRGSNKRGKSCAEIYGPQVIRFELARERLMEFSGRIADAGQKIRRLDDNLDFRRARAALPAARWKRIPGALRELAASRYHRYARGFGSFRKDVLR